MPVSSNKSRIEHILVLMLENRSYDHMFGYLPNGEGLSGKEYNLVDPLDPNSEKVYVSNTSGYVTATNPSHDVIDVEKQMYGEVGRIVHPAPMNGFVKVQIEAAKGDVEEGKKIMECFDPERIPALTTLAREFVLCDRWHSSVPGPTWVNRFYVHAATSDGVSRDDPKHLYEMKTIFDVLSENGFTWNVYFGDIPQSLILQHQADRWDHFKEFHRFHKDLERGELATYTFIEPRFINFHHWKATDQHPPHDVRLGEYLIAEVYDALRLSRFWETSLLVVLYDEHGGFFDHVSPPDPVPNPDGKVAVDPPFDFKRLGVRVPAVLISPWVEKGQVDSTVYEHASVPATIRALFGFPEALTARDRMANTFEKNLSRSTPRTDAPMALPVPGKPSEIRHHRQLLRSGNLEQRVRRWLYREEKSLEPLSSFQQSLVEMVDRLNEDAKTDVPPLAAKALREYDAAVHVYDSLKRFLRR
ncbi:MAG: phosphoesterase [Chloroflexi bacterium]|nr:phosphoesterase [Chloroflexota bacterium]